MIFDITFERNIFYVTIHKKFFENKSFPLIKFTEPNTYFRNVIVGKQFIIAGNYFGIDRILKKQKQDQNFYYYVYQFNEKDFSNFYRTINLCMTYVVGHMYTRSEFFETSLWDDQNLCLSLSEGINSFGISCRIFPCFKKIFNYHKRTNKNDFLFYMYDRLEKFLKTYNDHFDKNDLIIFGTDSLFAGPYGEYLQIKNHTEFDSFIESKNLKTRKNQQLSMMFIIFMNSYFRNKKIVYSLV